MGVFLYYVLRLFQCRVETNKCKEKCKKTNPAIDSVPQVVEAACHHSNNQTNKPMKRDGRIAPLIFLLHNADKALADSPIG